MKINFNMQQPDIAYIIASLLILVAVVMLVPYGVIWALNTLGASIEFNISTICAVWIIIAASGLGITITNQRNQ